MVIEEDPSILAYRMCLVMVKESEAHDLFCTQVMQHLSCLFFRSTVFFLKKKKRAGDSQR